MDVLELPRPVINFLRTMSKEMHRYALCWDIYGGNESVTLTLTWKLQNSNSQPNNNQNQQQQQQLSNEETEDTCEETDDTNMDSDQPPPNNTNNFNLRQFLATNPNSGSIGPFGPQSNLNSHQRFKTQPPPNVSIVNNNKNNNSKRFQHSRLDNFADNSQTSKNHTFFNNNNNNNNEAYYAINPKSHAYYRNLSAESQARIQYNDPYYDPSPEREPISKSKYQDYNQSSNSQQHRSRKS